MVARRAVLRVGTRGSPLARAQAAAVCTALRRAHPALAADDAIETRIIRTTGDRIRDRMLAEIGGKGLFTKEIEEALLANRIDLAVHSMKDMPTRLPDGLAIVCMLPREDPRDAFIDRADRRLSELPAGAVVGTASLRRAAQILYRRPDLRVAPLRGNVHTRIRKLRAGEFDGTLLALAGLRRLDLESAASAVLEADEMLPAVAQGAIGVETRSDDDRVKALLAPINHRETFVAVAAERAMLERLDGSCKTPIAGLGTISAGDRLHLKALVARPDGGLVFETERTGSTGDADALGADAGEELRRRLPPGFFDTTPD